MDKWKSLHKELDDALENMTDEDWKAWKLKRNKIKTEFVPYNLALRMKQLGFDEDCCKYVYVGDTGINVDHYLEVEPSKAKNYNKDGLCISQPLYQQAFRWFRNEHGLKSWVEEHTIDTFIYQIRPHVLSDYKEGEIYVYNTHEQTELACLEKLIEIVERNNIK
jgi:hypothetical protein